MSRENQSVQTDPLKDLKEKYHLMLLKAYARFIGSYGEFESEAEQVQFIENINSKGVVANIALLGEQLSKIECLLPLEFFGCFSSVDELQADRSRVIFLTLIIQGYAPLLYVVGEGVLTESIKNFLIKVNEKIRHVNNARAAESVVDKINQVIELLLLKKRVENDIASLTGSRSFFNFWNHADGHIPFAVSYVQALIFVCEKRLSQRAESFDMHLAVEVVDWKDLLKSLAELPKSDALTYLAAVKRKVEGSAFYRPITEGGKVVVPPSRINFLCEYLKRLVDVALSGDEASKQQILKTIDDFKFHMQFDVDKILNKVECLKKWSELIESGELSACDDLLFAIQHEAASLDRLHQLRGGERLERVKASAVSGATYVGGVALSATRFVGGVAMSAAQGAVSLAGQAAGATKGVVEEVVDKAAPDVTRMVGK